MTLEQQIALFDSLPPQEMEALGNVCIGLDKKVPKDLLRSLQRRGLIVMRQGRYDVASLFVHYAWCQWCSRKVTDEITGPI